jgi:hypothetical protein
LAEKAGVDFAVAEGGAANDDLIGAPIYNFCGARDGSNAAADADFEFVAFPGFDAEFFCERVVVAGTDGGVEVDEMEPGIGFEFFEEAEDVGDGEFAFAAVDELDGLSALEIDAGNQHG